MPSFSQKSLDNLSTCDLRLQRIFNEVIKHRDCTILEGHRGREAQEKAFAEGRSKARFGESKHNTEPSQAVDVLPYPIDWADKERIIEFAGFVLGVASQMRIGLKWGGHFKSFFDGPHFELTE